MSPAVSPPAGETVNSFPTPPPPPPPRSFCFVSRLCLNWEDLKGVVFVTAEGVTAPPAGVDCQLLELLLLTEKVGMIYSLTLKLIKQKSALEIQH